MSNPNTHDRAVPSHPAPGSGDDLDMPRDDARTFRPTAGEAITDSRNWPGYFVIALGLLALGLGLTAAGGGFEGWVVIASIACPLLFAVGIGLVLLERRRVKNRRGLGLLDQEGH